MGIRLKEEGEKRAWRRQRGEMVGIGDRIGRNARCGCRAGRWGGKGEAEEGRVQDTARGK